MLTRLYLACLLTSDGVTFPAGAVRDPVPLPPNLKVTGSLRPPPLADYPNLPFSLPCSAGVTHNTVVLLLCGTAWVAQTPTPVPFFNLVSSVPHPLSLQRRSSLIRRAVAGTDWWWGQGAAGLWSPEMLGEAVGWGVERISAGARGDWTADGPRMMASVCLPVSFYLH